MKIENEIARVYSIHKRDEECIQNYNLKVLREDTVWETYA
jgi:hypothetical protein